MKSLLIVISIEHLLIEKNCRIFLRYQIKMEIGIRI